MMCPTAASTTGSSSSSATVGGGVGGAVTSAEMEAGLSASSLSEDLPDSTAPGSRVDQVIILDCGSQFGKVIDRKCRELRVQTVVAPLETTSAYHIKVRDEIMIG